ncbi:hypothetical protein JY651_35575 [Pyxidicoccus parkwayensis]|uniref:Uncharacterized protein n=2 Tax=Pyxidicoccus parkwayensis TaxID=2813578 RepID=A0ABX7PDB4_9BACT|nr:hypothetical protein JY651_35575 [Pyxidicoccus parkwaysis]
MSEYQYYEFQAVDRPLTSKEQAELRALSTRAEISATRFTNVYHYGDFKGAPHQMMERYFDAHIYTANWGTRVFMLRLPRKRFDPRLAAPYLTNDQGISLQTTRTHVILTFAVEEEPGEWDETEAPELAELLPLRADLLAGDPRCLYLGWLRAVAAGVLDDEEVEPPVPPGMKPPSGALDSLARFLDIDPALLQVATAASPHAAARLSPSRDVLAAWVKALPSQEKDALLLRLVEGQDPHLGAELLQRFREGQAPAPRAATSPRTVGGLREAARALHEAQVKRVKELQAREKARHERELALAHEKALQALAAREAAAWNEVEAHFATRKPRGYDAGIQLLDDLGEVARRQGRMAEFSARVRILRELNARRPALLARLEEALRGVLGA